ncbi:Metallothionein expression activator, partial [Tulasnella sp. 403]
MTNSESDNDGCTPAVLAPPEQGLISDRNEVRSTSERREGEEERGTGDSGSASEEGPAVTSAPVGRGASPELGRAILESMRAALGLLSASPGMQAVLGQTVVPGLDGKSVLVVFQECVERGGVDHSLIPVLAEVVESVVQGHMGRKRKRVEDDVGEGRGGPSHRPLDGEGSSLTPSTSAPPVYIPSDALHLPLLDQVGHAIAIVHATLSHGFVPLDRSSIASIQAPLHQIFLFAATSAVTPPTPTPSPTTALLQEVSGLIQILGILHDVTITSPSTVHPLARTHQTIYNSGTPLPVRHLHTLQSSFTDIGTAVYPCLYPSCLKTFSKLSHLRTHAASHTFSRPFKCAQCPAAFARKYDLKRHEKSHGEVVFRCGGCGRKFTRRDALRRHKANEKNAKVCVEGAIEECEADEIDMRASSRRVKAASPVEAGEVEEGELARADIASAQEAVKVLHPLLQRHVTEKLAAGQGGEADPASAALLPATPSLLVGYNLNAEQTSMLERAIAAASEAARMQAEIEAQMELGVLSDDEE